MPAHPQYQSDAYGTDLGFGEQLQQALCILQVENKGSLDPDPLFSAYHHFHPTLLERIRAIRDRIRQVKKQKVH